MLCPPNPRLYILKSWLPVWLYLETGPLRKCVWVLRRPVVSDSLWPPWTVASQTPLFMGLSWQEYRVGCHFLLQGIFPTQGSNPCFPCLLNWGQILYHWSTWETCNPSLYCEKIHFYYLSPQSVVSYYDSWSWLIQGVWGRLLLGTSLGPAGSLICVQEKQPEESSPKEFL